MDLKEIIRKHALKNALDYGKTNPKSIIGRIIAEFPDARKDMKNVMQLAQQITNKVNSMKKEEIEKEMQNYTFMEKKKEESSLSLPNAEKGKVVTRFPPEPSGYLHIGHAKALFLNRTLADLYKGKMLLRFDDTNPEKSQKEYVNEVKKSMKWLKVKAEKESYTSDQIPNLYKYAEKMIELEKAYVCICSGDEIKENRRNTNECSCRNNGKNKNLELWNKMLNKEFKKGEAILRLKGDMNSLNTVMRDPTLFRILDIKHYKQGNKITVWPSYDFVVPILDSLEGVTHSLRTKEYELRRELYFSILDTLKLRKPELLEYARLSIKGTAIQKRVITSLVKGKKVDGWDDPRLPTLNGLKRKGILPEAIKNFVLRFGLTKIESEPDWEMLLKENRKLLDSESKHYFFVPEPVELKLKENKQEKRKKQTIELPLNPKDKNSKKRKLEVKDLVYIPEKDAKELKKDELIRLKDFTSVKITKTGPKLEGEVIEPIQEGKIIQWVSDDNIKCEIIVPGDLIKNEEYNPDSLTIRKGFCEKDCKKLKKGEIIQFERFGFVRLDKTGNNLIFVFSC